MLAAFLLAGLVVGPIATVALFTRTSTPGRTTGAWPATRRTALSVLGTVVLAAVSAAALVLLGATQRNAVAGALGFVVVSALWLPATR